MKPKFLIAIVIVVIFSGCYYNSEEELYGACDTGNVTYSQTVKPLFLHYGCMNCHSSPQQNGAPFSLETYADVKARVDAGRLLGAINHENGFAPMPQNGAKMSSCDIKKVEAWVTAGALDN